MQKIKLTYYLAMICALLCLVSTGFASWVTANQISQSVGGSSFGAYVSIDSSDYMPFANSEPIDCFLYSANGFVHVDNGGNQTINYNGTLTVSYTLKGDKVLNSFKNYSSVKFTYSLTCRATNELSIFGSSTVAQSIKISTIDSGYTTTANATNTKATLEVTVPYNIIADGDKAVTVTYAFTCADKAQYDDFYDLLTTANANFYSSVAVAGVN